MTTLPRLFLPAEQFQSEIVSVTGADHLHLARVLRARIGQQVILLDGRGNAFRSVLTEIGKSRTTAHIQQAIVLPPDPPIFITVAQALGKGDKFEQVVQHATEAGASAFIPVRTERSVGDIPADRIPERLLRWRTIAKGAAEQSFRSRIPIVGSPIDWKAVLHTSEHSDARVLLLHTASPLRPLSHVVQSWTSAPKQVLLLVGPEGGWSDSEAECATAEGCELVSLGPRILRTETAALVAVSQILFLFEA